MNDKTIARNYSNSEYNSKKSQLFRASLQLACKDWLTNKVDRWWKKGQTTMCWTVTIAFK
jgi:hypothetical protein